MDDLPAALRVSSPFPFVGRSLELEKLRTLLPTAAGEGRRVVLVGGEPGSGKSRLVREFAAEVAREGALVLYGACDAVVRTPYGPFAQALHRLVGVIDPEELAAAIGSGRELARLLPDFTDRTGTAAPPITADPDSERHRLHTAVTDLLESVSRRRPVLLVIEDGHWADAPTLLLLRHLARSVWAGRVLLFATFRDTEAEVPDALSQTLADLRRADDVARLRVGGLSDQEVSEFVERSVAGSGTGAEVPEIARAITKLTGGNAFLVCELWRAMVENKLIEFTDGSIRVTGALGGLGTPESVREVVSQRLARLEPATTELLELAATAGAEFELDLIRRSYAFDERELVAALDQAVRSGFIEELAGPRLAYRFAHELVRRAVYDRLTGVRRAERHLRVGEAWESFTGSSMRSLPDLAHHFAAAAALGEVPRAVKYSVLAARATMQALDFDEAAALLRTALELGIDDAAQRAEVLLELGTISHRAGQAFEAVDAFSAAAEIGRELENAELLARAAIGYEDATWRPGLISDPIALLEEAVTALGDEPSQLRVGLLSGLARALDMRGQQARAAIIRDNAVALARRLGDRTGLALVLTRAYWARGSTPIEEIQEMLAEAQSIGEDLGDAEIQADAISWSVPAFVAVADIDSARDKTALLRELAQLTAQPFNLHVAEHYDAAIAIADGRLTAAEELVHRSEEAGRLLTGRDASGTYGIQMFTLRREQGRLAELAPVIRVLTAGERLQGPWRPGLASLLAELDMRAEAKRTLQRIAAEGLEPYRESLWLASLTYLTDAAAAVGDEAMAALVYPELAPLSGANVMIGHLVAFYGSADRYLGMLAATLGEWERAETHFEQALALNRAMGARTWLGHTEYEYGRMLTARGRGGSERSAQLLGHAADLAHRIGLRTLSAAITAIGAAVSSAGFPDELSPREAQILSLVAQGLSNREIGATLVISEHTAANHIRSILRKTGCANRTEAASYAHRHALVDAPARG